MLDTATIKEVKTKIGEWCRIKRQNADLSQEELAVALGISRITVAKVESGKNATIDNILKIVNHFDGLQTIYKLLKQNIEDNNTNSLY